MDKLIGKEITWKNIKNGKTETGTVTGIEGGRLRAELDSGKKVFGFPDSVVLGKISFADEKLNEEIKKKYDDQKEKELETLVTKEPEEMKKGATGDVFPEGTIQFSKTHETYGCFSNFHTCANGVTYEGITYKNSEAAWQSLKTSDMEKRAAFAEKSGSQAKAAGRRVSLRKDWEEVKYRLMVEVCYAKFSQNPDLRQVLLDTGDRYLVEDTTGWHDNTWGNCRCPKCINKPGNNWLGKALMEVRKRLAKEGMEH